jgi:hypothetical protein
MLMSVSAKPALVCEPRMPNPLAEKSARTLVRLELLADRQEGPQRDEGIEQRGREEETADCASSVRRPTPRCAARRRRTGQLPREGMHGDGIGAEVEVVDERRRSHQQQSGVANGAQEVALPRCDEVSSDRPRGQTSDAPR